MNMHVTDNSAVFEQADFWEEYYENNFHYGQKIRILTDFIPNDVRTILDVGCGKGDLLRALNDKYDVCGCDRSAVALSHVTCRKDRCGTDHLPYDNEEFDLVTCCQVLEHLPNDIFESTIREITRVSRKYVIITVPYDEVLNQHVTKCAACSKIYHVSGHVRRFSDILSLMTNFPGFEFNAGWFCGYKMKYDSLLKRVLHHRILNVWHADGTAICPYCDSKEVVGQSEMNRIVEKILDKVKLIQALDRIFPPSLRPWWLGVLLEKR